MMTSRSDLRKKLRKRRRALSYEQQVQAGLGLANIFLAQPLLADSQNIAVYIANDGEIDPAGLVHELWLNNKSCYLPLVSPENNKHLQFIAYRPDSPMVKNRYGIPEPEYNPNLLIDPEELDVVLMPLTGFDKRGQRLGMGGGYYDRTFGFIRTAAKPVLIGLAHECQQVEQLPVENWDIPMEAVVTDKGFYAYG